MHAFAKNLAHSKFFNGAQRKLPPERAHHIPAATSHLTISFTVPVIYGIYATSIADRISALRPCFDNSRSDTDSMISRH
jgi:hypothetical protein